MKSAAEIGILGRVVTARIPTKWGMFNASGFERAANDIAQIDTAIALIMGDNPKVDKATVTVGLGLIRRLTCSHRTNARPW